MEERDGIRHYLVCSYYRKGTIGSLVNLNLKIVVNLNVCFQVKWAGYEDKYNTWEPSDNIKPFIKRYYEGKNIISFQ